MSFVWPRTKWYIWILNWIVIIIYIFWIFKRLNGDELMQELIQNVGIIHRVFLFLKFSKQSIFYRVVGIRPWFFFFFSNVKSQIFQNLKKDP